jgi:hypothetical protein
MGAAGACCSGRGEDRDPPSDGEDIGRKTTASVALNLSRPGLLTEEGSLDLEWEIVKDSIPELEYRSVEALRDRLANCEDHPACRVRPLHRQPQTLLRFLRAREGIVEQSEEMFRKSMEWRAEFGVDEKTAAWHRELEEGQTRRSRLFGKYSTDADICLDKYGVPVWLMRMSVSDPAGMVREVGAETLLINSLARMEAMHQNLRLQMFRTRKVIRGCVQILDVGDYGCHGVPMWWKRMFDGYNVGKEAFSIFDGNYPETTRKVFIIRMGRVTKQLHSLCSPLIPERTKQKMRGFGPSASEWADELRAEVQDASELPAFLLCDERQAYASAWPKGGQIPLGGDVPTSPQALERLRAKSKSGLGSEVGPPSQAGGSRKSLALTALLVLVLALMLTQRELFWGVLR